MNIEVWGGVKDGDLLQVASLQPEVRAPRPVPPSPELLGPDAQPITETPVVIDTYKLCWVVRSGKKVPVYVPDEIAQHLN